MKYINVYVNGNLAYCTVNHKTCKAAIAELLQNKGCPLLGLALKPTDKVTARFAQR